MQYTKGVLNTNRKLGLIALSNGGDASGVIRPLAAELKMSPLLNIERTHTNFKKIRHIKLFQETDLELSKTLRDTSNHAIYRHFLGKWCCL